MLKYHQTGIEFVDGLATSGRVISANRYDNHIELKLKMNQDSDGCFKVSGTVEQVRSCVDTLIERFGDATIKQEWNAISK